MTTLVLKLYKSGWFHRKNEEGLELVNKLPGVSVQQWNGETDGILLCSDYRPSLLETVPKVFFGPHVCFREGVRVFNQPTTFDVYYNCLSKWVVDLYQQYVHNPRVHFKSIPFPVDVDKFVPQNKINDTFFVYIKHIGVEKVEIIKKLLSESSLATILPYVFVYGDYNESIYRDAIAKCKFGIWIDAHESQGFALQEALACDCPLFVYDAQDMIEEIQRGTPYWGDWTGGTLPCTSASYFDDSCGMIYRGTEFSVMKEQFELFLDNVKASIYTPRKFVLDHLTPEKFVERINNLYNN